MVLDVARRFFLPSLITLFLAPLDSQLAPARAADASTTPVKESISLLTYNIQVGSDKGVFPNGWKERKLALIPTLRNADPDVLCTQEGRLEQLQYIDSNFPQLSRVGVGRDDGKDGGEFCAIFFKKERFAAVSSGTFWLSDTPDSSVNTWDPPYKRICTHVLLKDVKTGVQFAVVSTHFPLNPLAQTKSAELIERRLKKLYGKDTILLCGDFNCGPESGAWKVFEKAWLEPIDQAHQKTYHELGVATLCIDSIFRNKNVASKNLSLVKGKVGTVYASDHFGLQSKLEW